MAKKRHHKRRLVNFKFLEFVLRKLRKKGLIFFGTDNSDYFLNVYSLLKEMKKNMNFSHKKLVKSPLIVTKYHRRAKKLGNKVNFLKIEKF